MIDTIEQSAEKLVAATKRGDLAAAYGVVSQVPFRDLTALSLRAGFSCISNKNRRKFLVHFQEQIAQAARHKTDGYGLREQAD